jgi:hypothetical protein
MWELMIEKLGCPPGITRNPYELLVRFFEAGGMYETEHNMHVGYIRKILDSQGDADASHGST